MNIYERIEKVGIVPVVVLDDSEDAIDLGKALLNGGIDVAEITFRTEAAEESIKKMSEELPEILVGAGTVLTMEQLEKAINAGAKFIVSPGFDENIVNKCVEENIPVFPGTVTPTDIIKAINSGLDVVKFFPAGNYGGLKTIKSLSGPFNNIKFMPTGGVNSENLEEYLKFDKIIAVGGSWIADKKLIKEKNFKEIEKIAKEARDIFKKIRG